MTPGNNILMRERAVLKRVQLPDGRVFYAKYEKIRRANLPTNIRVQKTYKKRQHSRTQKGRVIKSTLKKAYNFGKKQQIQATEKC